MNTRKFLEMAKLKLLFRESYVISRQRIHDEYLMEMVLDQKDFKEKDIFHINIVRLYLQLLTMADIVKLQGNKLLKDIQEMLHS